MELTISRPSPSQAGNGAATPRKRGRPPKCVSFSPLSYSLSDMFHRAKVAEEDEASPDDNEKTPRKKKKSLEEILEYVFYSSSSLD